MAHETGLFVYFPDGVSIGSGTVLESDEDMTKIHTLQGKEKDIPTASVWDNVDDAINNYGK